MTVLFEVKWWQVECKIRYVMISGHKEIGLGLSVSSSLV